MVRSSTSNTVVLLGALTWGFAAICNASFEEQCLSFRPQDAGIVNASVTQLAFVAANTTIDLSDNDVTCATASQTVRVDLCRVALNATTSDRSSVIVEVWLPEEWNGRLVTTGNGGLAGCIAYADIAYTSSHGFASVGTNNGHNGTSGIQFLDNTEVVVDFAWRAVHTGVEAGRKLLTPFYGDDANKSYFIGCSLGGRQGVKAADMFPSDFDGIVAGAPAVDFNNLYSWRARFFPITGSTNSTNFISSTTWKTTIHDEVLRQCDTIDGVADGIIEDPNLCDFDPTTLLCTESNDTSSDACLTEAQISIVQKILEPLLWPNGTLLYPAMEPGNELLTANGLYSGTPWVLSQGWFRYAVYNNISWDPATFTLADAEFAEDLNPGNIRTYPDSLAAFQDRGGKMVVFHGQQDNQITPFNTPRFYQHLQGGMNYTVDQMDEFLRYFRISGMFHCNSGPGAWVVGQGGGASAQGSYDREHNVLAALVDWVEEGVAPERMTGTKYVNDTVALGVDFQRSHCRWPLRSTYLGESNDPKDPASWGCKET